MKRLFILLLSFAIGIANFAQTSNLYSSIGGTFDDEIKNISLLPDGGYITSGMFQTTADLNPTPITLNVTSNGQSDIFLSRFAANGDLVWSVQFGGSMQEEVTDMVIANNSIYLIGNFDGSVDFDPSANTNSLTSLGVQDGFFAAFNLDGQFQWVQHIGGAAGDMINCMTISQDDKIILGINSYSSPLNFNTNGTATHLNSIGQDFIIAVYNFDGTYQSSVAISNDSSNGYGSINGLATDNTGAIYATGFVADPGYNFNPNAEANIVSVANSGNVFIVKYDSNFFLSWLKTFGAFGYDTGNDIAIFDNSKIIATGIFSGSVVVDDQFPALTGNSGDAGFVVELNSDGEYQFVGGMAGEGNVSPNAIKMLTNGQYYIAGRYSNTFDTDPTEGISTSPPASNFLSSGFVIKINSDNNLVWMERVGLGSEHYLHDIAVDDSQEIYLVGSFNFNSNFSIGEGSATLTSAGSLDGFLLSIEQDLCSAFTVTAINLDNATCESIGQINLELAGGTEPYSITWQNGEVINQNDYIFLTQGVYNVFITDNNGCTRTRTWVMDGPASNVGNDLIVTTHHTEFPVGQSSTIRVDVYNQLCSPATGEVVVLLPAGLIFTETDAIGYTLVDNIFTVPFANLDYDSDHFQFFVRVYLPFGVYEVGDEVQYSVEVVLDEASNDLEQNFSNNLASVTADAVSAFDPNDKQVYPRGECEQGYLLQPEYLRYTIRFQNTGNFAAQNIYLFDTLSTHLDPQSIIIRASHPFYPEVEIIESNILKFTYTNIFLPDSTSSPEDSNGWVTFEISPINNDLPNGTEITNKAGIIFDANPAIITNTVLNTIVDEIPSVNLTVINEIGSISAVQEGVSYQWFDCVTNTPLEGLTSQTVSPEVNGNYGVEMALPGCAAVQSECYDYIVVGVEEMESNKFFTVYPNPSAGEINLNLSNNLENALLHIYNNLGQEINTINLRNTANSTLSINLPSGVYQFVLTNNGETVESMHVIRE